MSSSRTSTPGLLPKANAPPSNEDVSKTRADNVGHHRQHRQHYPPVVRSPSIENATQQVVKAAVNMERSDSVLYDDYDYDDDNASSMRSDVSRAHSQQGRHAGDNDNDDEGGERRASH